MLYNYAYCLCDMQFVGLTTIVGLLIASKSGMICYVHYNREISTACFNV